MSNSKRIWITAFTLTLLPPLVLIIFVFYFHIEAPAADQWELVPLLERSIQGKITVVDFWNQHNEHRIFFPRIVMIFLARLTHWTLIYELLASFVSGCCIFLICAKMFRDFHPQNQYFLPVLSVIIFSLSQSEGWLNSWNLQIYLNVLAACALIFVLSGGTGFTRLVIAFLLLGISFLSYASGIVLWPVGLLLLIPWIQKSRIQGMISFALWLAGGAALLSLYLYNYFRPAQHPSIYSVLGKPLQLFEYVFAYLGAPLFAFTRKAEDVNQWTRAHGMNLPSLLFDFIEFLPVVAGFAAFAGFASITIHSLRSRVEFQQRLAITSFGLFALGSGILSGLGRTGFGDFSALSLRYISISNLFWIALLAGMSGNFYPKKTLKIRLFVAGLIFLIVCNSIYGFLYAVKQRAFLIPAQQELHSLNDNALLERLYPDAEKLKRYSLVLKKYRLNVYKDGTAAEHD